MHGVRVRLAPLVVLLCLLGLFAPTVARAAPVDPLPQLAIQLLDGPTSEQSNPRAHVYIIDQLDPGQQIIRHVRVTNRSPKTVTLSVYAGAASISGGAFQFGRARAGNELTSWIRLDPSQVRLVPAAHADITASITVPRQGGGGEHYGVIWAEQSSVPGPGNVSEINRVGIRIYLDVSGTAAVTDFRIGPITAGRTAAGIPTLTARVDNVGKRAVDISGDVGLSNGPGDTAVPPVQTDRVVTIAPGGSERVTASFSRELANGPWRAAFNLTSGLTNRSAVAQVRFPATAATSAPAVPATATVAPTGSTGGLAGWLWWLLAIAVLALVIVLLLIWRRRRPAEAPRSDVG